MSQGAAHRAAHRESPRGNEAMPCRRCTIQAGTKMGTNGRGAGKVDDRSMGGVGGSDE